MEPYPGWNKFTEDQKQAIRYDNSMEALIERAKKRWPTHPAFISQTTSGVFVDKYKENQDA